MIYLVVALLAILIFFYMRYAGITRELPVLMYHHVSPVHRDPLTVNTTQLEKHFRYFAKKKFTTIFLSDLVAYAEQGKPLPPNPLMLTFDDGYKDNFTNLYPLLQQYNLKANIFLVASFIGDDREASDSKKYLNIGDINGMRDDLVQFGLHTYDHKNYANMSIGEIEEDIKLSKKRLDNLGIVYRPCLAYTYGAYVKKDPVKRHAMFTILANNGVQLAMRIGNRINKLPLKNKMLVERIDIRGDESFFRFRISLYAGRKIFFN